MYLRRNFGYAENVRSLCVTNELQCTTPEIMRFMLAIACQVLGDQAHQTTVNFRGRFSKSLSE